MCAAPRFEGASPGAWLPPAFLHLSGLGVLPKAGCSPAPARHRPAPARALSPIADCPTLHACSSTSCISYARSLPSQAFAALVPGRLPAASTSFRGDLSAMEDEDIEHLLRSSSEERPSAKAQAGRPPRRTCRLRWAMLRTASSTGSGSGCGGGLCNCWTRWATGPYSGNVRACLDLPLTPFLTRASFRQALRGTLRRLFVELNIWRQLRLPRLRCPKQARPFSFQRRLLACNTTSASRCRPRAS